MNTKEYEKILKALGNSRRLDIIGYLHDIKEATVSDIAVKIKLSFKATSKHLIFLSTLNILEKDQRNLLVFYRLNPSPTKPIKSLINTIFSK